MLRSLSLKRYVFTVWVLGMNGCKPPLVRVVVVDQIVDVELQLGRVCLEIGEIGLIRLHCYLSGLRLAVILGDDERRSKECSWAMELQRMNTFMRGPGPVSWSLLYTSRAPLSDIEKWHVAQR